MTALLTKRQDKPPHRKQRWGMALAIVLLVALAFTVSGVFPLRQILAQERAVGLEEAKLAAIQAENERLTQEIVGLQTPEEIERIAREQFGLVRPGEVAYVVVSPPGVTPTTLPPEPTLDRPEEQPWCRDLWDFLTGRDLQDDG